MSKHVFDREWLNSKAGLAMAMFEASRKMHQSLGDLFENPNKVDDSMRAMHRMDQVFQAFLKEIDDIIAHIEPDFMRAIKEKNELTRQTAVKAAREKAGEVDSELRSKMVEEMSIGSYIWDTMLAVCANQIYTDTKTLAENEDFVAREVDGHQLVVYISQLAQGINDFDVTVEAMRELHIKYLLGALMANVVADDGESSMDVLKRAREAAQKLSKERDEDYVALEYAPVSDVKH